MAFHWKLLLIVLLAFRATIAPLTYRSANSNPTRRNGIVISVRQWPAQRLQRFSGASKLLKLYRGKDKVVPDVELRMQRLVACSGLSRFGADMLAVWFAQSLVHLPDPLPTTRLTTFLRC